MSLFVNTLQIFEKRGFLIGTGLNPGHFKNRGFLELPFTCLFLGDENRKLSTGGGIAPIEVYLLECLAEVYSPSRIFVIGNAFGWSSIALCLAFPRAQVVVIDAGIEGGENMAGIELTRKIAKEEGFNCAVEFGLSPSDTPAIALRHFGSEPIDLVFIDGMHTNKQLEQDFLGAQPFCDSNTLFLVHDVLNWKMERAFSSIRLKLPDHDSHILYRTTSGMGVCIPKGASSSLRKVAQCFGESELYLSSVQRSISVKQRSIQALAGVLPVSLLRLIRRIPALHAFLKGKIQ